MKAVPGDEAGFFLKHSCHNFRFVWIALRPPVAFPLLSKIRIHLFPNPPIPSEICGSDIVVGGKRTVVQVLWMLFVPVEHCDL